MTSAVYFCVDGGGTRSRGRLTDADGVTLASAVDGPCNPNTDCTRAVGSVMALWRRCAADAGHNPEDRAGITLAIGSAGLNVMRSRAAFVAACPPFGRILPINDGYAALIGAGAGKPCGMVAVGTGVTARRLLPDGTNFFRDGWGWIVGDRGGGAWIGLEAFRHALEVKDTVAPPWPLAESLIATICGSESLDDLLANPNPERMASLTPFVLAAADAGDPVALGIRDRAVDHLVALARSLKLADDDTLYFSGGLAVPLWPFLVERLGRPIAEPLADAMTGAYLVASGRAPAEVEVAA
jgi:glucosamine kinase